MKRMDISNFLRKYDDNCCFFQKFVLRCNMLEYVQEKERGSVWRRALDYQEKKL